MSVTRTLTLTKTAASPANAFDLYPSMESVASPEEIAAHKELFPYERAVEITENSMIITLVFPNAELAKRIITEDAPVQERMHQARKLWMEENLIDEVIETHDTV